jgi:hypothetical protein
MFPLFSIIFCDVSPVHFNILLYIPRSLQYSAMYLLFWIILWDVSPDLLNIPCPVCEEVGPAVISYTNSGPRLKKLMQIITRPPYWKRI